MSIHKIRTFEDATDMDRVLSVCVKYAGRHKEYSILAQEVGLSEERFMWCMLYLLNNGDSSIEWTETGGNKYTILNGVEAAKYFLESGGYAKEFKDDKDKLQKQGVSINVGGSVGNINTGRQSLRDLEFDPKNSPSENIQNVNAQLIQNDFSKNGEKTSQKSISKWVMDNIWIIISGVLIILIGEYILRKMGMK